MSLPALETLYADVALAKRSNDPTGLLLVEHAWTRLVLDELGERLRDSEEGLASAGVDELGKFIDLHIRREEEAFFPALEPIAQEIGLGSTSDMYGEHDAIRIRLGELQEAISRQND